MIQELSNKLQEILTESSDKYSRDSGFVKRESKLTGSKFAQGLIFGWQNNPNISLSELTQVFSELGVNISEQGLSKRFNESGIFFMEKLLRECLLLLNNENEVSSLLLSKFSDVKVYDSTTVMLPKELIEYWTGNGSRTGSKTTSAIKISASLSLKSGSLNLSIEDGFNNDRNAELIINEDIVSNSLSIKDMGYFSLESFDTIDKKGAYYCSRLKLQTKIYSLDDKELDILNIMNDKIILDKDVIVGNTQRLKCRLLVSRLSKEKENERINEIKKQAKREGLQPSKNRLKLAAFNIFITNADRDKLSFDEALVLMKSRWQIELLFKLWKSYCQIDKSRSKNSKRILIELYAKLIGAIISHQFMVIGMWNNIDRSMFKAIKIIQKNIPFIIESFSKGITEIQNSVQKICSKLEDCRIKKRGKRPATYQFIQQRKIYSYA